MVEPTRTLVHKIVVQLIAPDHEIPYEIYEPNEAQLKVHITDVGIWATWVDPKDENAIIENLIPWSNISFIREHKLANRKVELQFMNGNSHD